MWNRVLLCIWTRAWVRQFRACRCTADGSDWPSDLATWWEYHVLKWKTKRKKKNATIRASVNFYKLLSFEVYKFILTCIGFPLRTSDCVPNASFIYLTQNILVSNHKHVRYLLRWFSQDLISIYIEIRRLIVFRVFTFRHFDLYAINIFREQVYY